MWWFILACVLALLGVGALVVGVHAHGSDDDEDAGVLIAGGAAMLAIAIGIFALDSSVIIPTRNVGVQVSFGKTNTTLHNGWHWVAPWSSVEKFDASVQTLKLTQGAKGDDDDLSRQPCATVRLANQTIACVDATVQWNIDPDGDVADLYKRYRTFDKIEINLIERQLQHALNLVFERYDPLRGVTGKTDESSITLDDLAKRALAELQSSVDAGIRVDSITISLVHYDGTTQDKLNAYAQALADTRLAEQRKVTAQLIADANAILASSTATKDPGVQYQNCLDMIRALAERNQLQNLPEVFTCGAGSGTPVIVGK